MIVVDESDPVDELEPAFPYRDVAIRRDVVIREAYTVLEEIGRGKFGRVYRCRDRETGLNLAAKVVTTKRREERINVEREIEIMRKLQHPRVIQLFDAIEDDDHSEMCLVLEMVCGGELFDRVIQDEFILTERACAVFVRQICEAVEYIHSKSILHLDMKPENVMCLSKAGNRIKIIDFGLARFYDPTKKLQVLFGTPEFVAPEVVNFDSIDYSTDMWSVGVITYVLLSGLSPFMGDTDVETMANVTIAKYDFDDEAFDDISEDAKNFISKLLTKDKRKRISASECLKHVWLALKPSRSHSTVPATLSHPVSSRYNELECSSVEDLEEEVDSDTSSSPVESDELGKSSDDTDSDITLSPIPPPALARHRPSLELTKDHLRDFVSRWTDNPYLFDSPRGVIAHLAANHSDDNVKTNSGGSCSGSNTNHVLNKSPAKKSNSGTSSIDCEMNIVSQIRRFSYQLHEELEIMKKHTNSNLRKCSWGEVPVNAQ